MAERKELQITCPCCSSRLVVDLRTERVVSHRRPEQLDEAGKPRVDDGDWKSAFDRVRERSDEGPSKLDAALERERGRAGSLDDLFERAKEKFEEPEDEDDDASG